MIDTNWSEHYLKRGDLSKPTYYIIRRNDTKVGLFSNFIVFAGHIRYALSKGWLPVIDMQNYANAYLAPEKLGKENAWEYYFEQPLRIGLEQAYAGENVILSNGKANVPRPHDGMSFFENQNNILTKWHVLVELGLLNIKPELIQEIAAVRQNLFTPNDRVLGVLLRGTDYVANQPKNHSIPPHLSLLQARSLPNLTNGIAIKFSLQRKTKLLCRHLNRFSAICV